MVYGVFLDFFHAQKAAQVEHAAQSGQGDMRSEPFDVWCAELSDTKKRSAP